MNSAQTTALGKIVFLFFGLLIGLALALLFFFFFFRDKSQSDSDTVVTLSLSLSEPDDLVTTTSKILTIKGSTTTGNIVTLNSPAKSTVIQANNGQFSTSLDLVEGKNIINITSFNPTTGDSRTLQRQILYLDEDLSHL